MHSLLSRAESLSSTLPPLLIEAERVAATVAQGMHGRRRVGQGDSFWQYRAYQPDDPAAMIDWRQSARSDKLFVRQTEWEAAQTVWLWRDMSASMNYRSSKARPPKRERAALILLALAVLLTRGGERIALLDGTLPPGGGRASLLRLAAAFQASKAGGTSSLPPAAALPQYGHVVLAGDFFTPLEEVESAIQHLAGQGMQGVMIQICDPAEIDFPFRGRVRFRGPEGEGDMLARRAEDLGEEYRRRMNAHAEGLSKLAQAAGWLFLAHRTDQTPQSILLSLYAAFSKRGGQW